MAPALDPSPHGDERTGRIRPGAASDGPRDSGSPRRRTLQRRKLRIARPTTVWPCAPRGQREPTGDAWLERAVVKIVTTYTEPGQRVLLISPPPPRPGPPPRWTTTARRWPPDPYETLPETNWTVSRLGRSVQTTLTAHPDDHPAEQSAALDYRASTPDLTATSSPRPNSHHHDEPVRPSRVERPGETCRRGHARGRVECFDLILTAAHPRDHAWFTTRDWRPYLRPHGALAVITHSERSDGRLADPLTDLVVAVRDSGLGLLDHIILLDSPPADHRDTLASQPDRAAWRPLRHQRIHHDLLAFTDVETAVR